MVVTFLQFFDRRAELTDRVPSRAVEEETMKLSKTSTQAVLALSILANHDAGEFLQARQVAEQLGTPTMSALKILQALARHKLIESQLGRSGGYRLHLPPDQVNLLQVVEAIEGPVAGQMRITDTPAPASEGLYVLQAVCEQAAHHIRAELRGTTIADVARRSQPKLLATAG